MREIATLGCLAGILLLLRLDRERAARVSGALWLPVAWTFLAGSRSVSEWVGSDYQPETPDVLLDGSPLDRFVITTLLVVGIGVLLSRWPRVAGVLRANGPVVIFVLWAGASVLWSDYPDVAFKRWIKACGNVVMVLIVLTEADPAAALRRYLARLAFMLIPLSVLFIKYYPDLGRQYHRWTWTVSYTGVTMSKNSLGYVCLVFGIASLWRVLEARRPSPRSSAVSFRTRRRARLAHGLIVVMTLWLLLVANSATSLACFVVAGLLMMAVGRPSFARSPHMIVGLGLVVALCGLLFADLFTAVLGRDPTLTGRTDLWDQLVAMTPNPVLGAGYESFWLGDRLERLWQQYWWHPNQAHNGYLEIFLNLGAIGVGLLASVIFRGYRNVVVALNADPSTGRLRLAYLVAAVLYNFTEAAFKGMHLVWIIFFLAVVRGPRPAPAPVVEAPLEDLALERFPAEPVA